MQKETFSWHDEKWVFGEVQLILMSQEEVRQMIDEGLRQTLIEEKNQDEVDVGMVQIADQGWIPGDHPAH